MSFFVDFRAQSAALARYGCFSEKMLMLMSTLMLMLMLMLMLILMLLLTMIQISDFSNQQKSDNLQHKF